MKERGERCAGVAKQSQNSTNPALDLTVQVHHAAQTPTQSTANESGPLSDNKARIKFA